MQSDNSMGSGQVKTGEIDFQLIFQSLPGLFLILLPDKTFTIAAMSDAYSRKVMLTRKKVKGCGVFEVFPDDPTDPHGNGVVNLRASLERVLEGKEADFMPIQKYSYERADKAGFEVGYWSVNNTPVLDDAGNILYIIHKVEDITDYIKSKYPDFLSHHPMDEREHPAETAVYSSVQQVEKINERLRSSRADLVRDREGLLKQLYEQNLELQLAYERTQLALEAASLGEWEIDLKTGVATRNLGHDMCFGYQTLLPEWNFDIFMSHVHADDKLYVEEKFKLAIEHKVVWDFECRITWQDGSLHWIAAHGRASYDEHNKPVRMAGTVADITKKKAEAEALLKSEARIRSLLNSTAEGIWGIDLQGKITFMNDSAVRMLGFDSAEQVIGKNAHSLVHHTRADGSPYLQADCPIYHALENGNACHLENEVLWRVDGSSFYADYRSTPIMEDGKNVGLVTSFVDNTQRIMLSKALKESQEWLAATLKSIGDGVIATSADLEQNIVFMNPVAEALTGWSLEEARGMPVQQVFRIINQHTREPAENPIERVIKEKRIVGLANHTILIAKNGKEYVIEDSAAPIIDSKERMSGVVLVFRDTTEKALAEEREKLLLQEVEAARQDLHDVFMQAPMPIAILVGPQHQVVLANAPYSNFVQRDVVGKLISEAFSYEEVRDFIPLLDGVYQTGVPFVGRELPFSIPNQHGNITTHYVDFVYHPFKNAQGESKGILVVAQDVTDQVLARNVMETAKNAIENERENFRNLFRQTPEMVCMLSGSDHVFEFVNNAHIRALGFDATGQSVRGAQPESIEVHGILDEVFRTGIPALLREIPVTIGTRLRYFNLTYAARRSLEGAINGIMVLGSEVTDQVEARDAIVRAKEAADAANHEKTAFIANMSHEIRTPIGVIMGFCELLLEDDVPHTERKDYLDRIIKNTKGLTRIIDDILDLAKVEAGKLDVEESEFSLNSILHEVIDLFSDRARQKNIYLQLQFENSLPEIIHSDPARLRQILINVIGNAIKFTTSGGVKVVVASKLVNQKRLKFEIRVIDTGIGLSKTQMDKIFEPFVQADVSTSRLFGGTGLGLAISRRLAIALGGGVDIENCKEGEGCTFVVSFFDGLHGGESKSLLRAGSSQRTHDEADGNALQLSGIKILVAEDSLDNQLLVRRILTKHGATVSVAQDGEEAIKFALSGNFDLILMDVQMPRVNGYEATRALRQVGFQQPIIALTAHAMLEEKAKTREAGCNAHLTKPINSTELLAIIEEYVRGTGLES